MYHSPSDSCIVCVLSYLSLVFENLFFSFSHMLNFRSLKSDLKDQAVGNISDRQLSPLYAISQKPWDLCQLCQIDNCFPCMFYLRNHEIYVKLYQTIVYLVHFISETMRAMSNYIRQLSPLYVLSQKPWELCQIISGNCLPCTFYLRTHESYVKLNQSDNCLPCMYYLRNHESESYVKLYQSDNCLPCMLYLRNHESYVKQDELWANSHLWYPRSLANRK